MKAPYTGPERRGENLQHVAVERIGLLDPRKLAHQALGVLFSIFLTLLCAIPGTLWVTGKWVGRLESQIEGFTESILEANAALTTHVREDNEATAQLRAATIEQDKTLTRVVVNQENLQARLERLERAADSAQ